MVIQTSQVYKVKSYTEGTNKSGRPTLFLKGKSQQTTENQNKRIYGEELWDYMMTEDKRYKRRLEKRLHLGSIGHPKDGIFDPEKSAIVMTDQHRDGEDIITTHEVLETPSGMIMYTLHEAGVEFGLSSRGSGESTEKDGLTIVSKGFDMEGYDAVIDPSVEDANPTYVLKEQVEKDPKKNLCYAIEHRMQDKDVTLTEVDFYQDYLESHYTDKTSESYGKVVSFLESKTTELTDTGADKKGTFDEQFLNLLDEFETFKKDVASRINLKIESKSNMADKSNEVLIEEGVQSKIKLSQLEAVGIEANKKLEASKKLLLARDKTIEEGVTTLEGVNSKLDESAKRLEASKQLLSAALDQIDSMKEEHATLTKRHEAAKKIIGTLQDSAEKTTATSLESVIATEVAKFPEVMQESVKSTLTTVESIAQVMTVVANLHAMKDNLNVDTTLPAGGTSTAKTEAEKLEAKKEAAKKLEGAPTLQSIIAKNQQSTWEARKAESKLITG